MVYYERKSKVFAKDSREIDKTVNHEIGKM